MRARVRVCVCVLIRLQASMYLFDFRLRYARSIFWASADVSLDYGRSISGFVMLVRSQALADVSLLSACSISGFVMLVRSQASADVSLEYARPILGVSNVSLRYARSTLGFKNTHPCYLFTTFVTHRRCPMSPKNFLHHVDFSSYSRTIHTPCFHREISVQDTFSSL